MVPRTSSALANANPAIADLFFRWERHGPIASVNRDSIPFAESLHNNFS